MSAPSLILSGMLRRKWRELQCFTGAYDTMILILSSRTAARGSFEDLPMPACAVRPRICPFSRWVMATVPSELVSTGTEWSGRSRDRRENEMHKVHAGDDFGSIAIVAYWVGSGPGLGEAGLGTLEEAPQGTEPLA
ncbi:hypothetical protein B0T20DRAFT_389042 [Sordaria brevicollis]|uniref:Uncharacterized protein n=1 Tax=Sordaria brevicollis TaxID=83679 RepID=A0AAE0PP17_SORBR|nr:hypothetical protein B0T20DRAFT_389042 [Sordaria brevicollis]